MFRIFDCISDAVTPYLDDRGTKADDINTDLLAIISLTESFLEKARNWHRAQTDPSYGQEMDEEPDTAEPSHTYTPFAIPPLLASSPSAFRLEIPL